MQRENKWQDRFDEKFVNGARLGGEHAKRMGEEMKSFIQSEIDRATEEALAGITKCIFNGETFTISNNQDLKGWVKQLTDRAVAEERERIIEVIKSHFDKDLPEEEKHQCNVLINEILKDIKNLINK